MLMLPLVATLVLSTAMQGSNQAPQLVPSATPDVPTSEYLSWRGWGYLSGSTPSVPMLYRGVGDWSGLQGVTPPPASEAPTWRTKIVVFRSVERLGKDAQGLLRSDRQTIEDGQMAEVMMAVRRMELHFAKVTGGKLRFQADVTPETETMRAPLASVAFDGTFLHRYLEPRINGGGYQAEDRIYRGPYQSIICLFPGAFKSLTTVDPVYGVPVSAVSIEQVDAPFVPGVLDTTLRGAIRTHAEHWAKQHGYSGLGPGESFAGLAEIATTAIPTAERLLEREQTPTPLAVGELFSRAPSGSAWRTPRAEYEVVSDESKGQVVKLTLRSPTRAAGISLPALSDGSPLADLAATPTLTISLKTLAKDPIALRLEGRNGKRAWVALGKEIEYEGASAIPVRRAPIKADGTWETASVNVAELSKEADLDAITGIALEFTPLSRSLARTLSDPSEVFISDVRFVADPATPVTVEPSESELRAVAATKATQSSPELVAMLADRAAVVQLNVAEAFTRIKDPAAEPGLANLSVGADSSVAEVALRALAFQGTETAAAAIRLAVRRALTDHARGLAALSLAQSKDPKNGGDLSALLARPSWQTRRRAVEGLALLPGREAGLLRLAFLAQENPEIKLAVTESVDPKDEPIARRLLWSVVNEPQDRVRALSAEKLIQSPIEELRQEGYKAVRDDSPTVRILLLEYLERNPNEAHRPALLLGLADANPSVRAAALRAFAQHPSPPTAAELGEVPKDAHPWVQLGLVALAKVRPGALPPGTVDRLKASPFASVRNVAQEIGNP